MLGTADETAGVGFEAGVGIEVGVHYMGMLSVGQEKMGGVAGVVEVVEGLAVVLDVEILLNQPLM